MADLFIGGSVDAATHERTATDSSGNLTIATDSLTTHGVIVGMTGSGKTGLGIDLIEEILRSGRPVLAIDPKGDLTNLCLTFPALEAKDFEPWIDPAQAAAAGQDTPTFAAAQADLWRNGLAGWGLGGGDIQALRDAVDFTIYTPGSRSGVPVNIVGSLDVPDTTDAEVIGDEIDGFVTGLLGLIGVAADPLSSREHILLSNLIAHSWNAGTSIDLVQLVQMVTAPPIRKLGVFELDQFFPEADRTKLAMRLNGLLAAPSFADWAQGPPIDIQSMLYRPDGGARCAIVTTAHLSDDERQFVTALILSKLVTWMRRQSGTTDLRALLYMDEVAGYLPPTEKPPTKQPIMLLMKQARAFGLGVVLSTQNPVDLDYKALSNAGTWMVGRLQTERDKARVVEGMSSAAGSVDIAAVDATITGLAKREFVLRRAGKDRPEVFTTRWAMSYLRGPMTRDQIASLTAPPPAPSGQTWGPPRDQPAAAPTPETVTSGPAQRDTLTTAAAPGSVTSGPAQRDTSPVMPKVADGVTVAFVDPATEWIASAGGSSVGTTYAAAAVARVAVRYDETKADLVHDVEYEAVLHPLSANPDINAIVEVDYDDRDLRAEVPANPAFRLSDAPIDTKAFWTGIERSLRDHLARSLTLEVPMNVKLKLYGRPGETPEAFAARCTAAADALAEADIAKLRDKYEAKATRLAAQLDDAQDRAGVLQEQAEAKRNSEMLSTAGSLLGGLLGGRSSLGGLLGKAGTAASRRGSTNAANARVDAAQNKIDRIQDEITELEADLADEMLTIKSKWDAVAVDVSTMTVGLEKTDVNVVRLTCGWLPVE